MMYSPQRVVEMFEENMAAYTGATWAVSCDNCTNAIRMCCEYYKVEKVTIPARTYLSVPQSIMQAGGSVEFEDTEWSGIYQLKPYPIYDASKRLTSLMYIPDTLMCLSFGIRKPLPIGKGGMILTNNLDAYDFLRQKRWSGRREEFAMADDQMPFLGYNSYMTPEQAARGMMLLSIYPDFVGDQIEDPPYPDLRNYELFSS